MKKMLISMLLILGLIFTLSACSNEATDSPDGTGIGQVTEIETIYIGALFPSNGAQAELIADLQAAMLVAADIINNSHDIEWDLAQNAGLANYGHAKVEIVFADCGVTAASARVAAEELISQGVSIITGCYDSTLTAAVAEVCQKHGIPMISGSARDDSLTDGEQSFASVFNRIAMSSIQETDLFLNYLNQYNLTTSAGIQSAAIAYINNDYGNTAAEYLETSLNNNGLQVVAIVGYDASSTDFAEPASRMIANAVKNAFLLLPQDLRDPIPEPLRKQQQLWPLRDALETVHFPRTMDGLRSARRRMIFEELLVLQLGLLIMKSRKRGESPLRLTKY
mgnify:CR=1 FL=1